MYQILFVILQTTNNDTYRIMEDKLHTTNLEQIAHFAKAMGHPTRMAILAFLAKQDSCFFGDIHELKEAGLIQGEVEAPKVKYCINKDNWQAAKKMFADFFAQPCNNKGCRR